MSGGRYERDRDRDRDRDRGSNDSKVYVGNLPRDVRGRDLEDVFYKFGKILDVDLHDNRDNPFAFVEFEDPRDANDAIKGRNGYVLDGARIRVEFPHSSNRGGGGRGGGFGGGRGRGGGYDRGGFGGGGGGRFQRGGKGHRLQVSGLPPTGSWQDVKDHFREAGDVMYADVYKDGSGVVEFSRYEHMRRALRDLDDSKFRSHEGETSYIRVKDPNASRSPSPKRYSRSRSRSRSPRSHSRSRSR